LITGCVARFMTLNTTHLCRRLPVVVVVVFVVAVSLLVQFSCLSLRCPAFALVAVSISSLN